MKTKLKFAGSFLSENIETKRILFYVWNEYRPCKVLNNEGNCTALYMRVRIKDKVYFISDNETIDTFLNLTSLLNSSFFLEYEYDATDIPENVIDKYFQLIS